MPAAPEEHAVSLPSLPTPDSFPFPYVQPYSIQLDLMRTVFQAIENGKIAIASVSTPVTLILTMARSSHPRAPERA